MVRLSRIIPDSPKIRYDNPKRNNVIGFLCAKVKGLFIRDSGIVISRVNCMSYFCGRDDKQLGIYLVYLYGA